MKCSAVLTFLSALYNREEVLISSISPADLDYLCAGGYVARETKEDYDNNVASLEKLTQLSSQIVTERKEEEQEAGALRKDEDKEHSFVFRLKGEEKKVELEQRIQSETAVVTREQAELKALEANVDQLIQTKSMVDRMVPYGSEYLSLTDLGTTMMNDLRIRDYRVADEEFADFTAEVKATYAELRSIADRSTVYVALIKPQVPDLKNEDHPSSEPTASAPNAVEAPSLVWSTALGLAKIQGDTNQIGGRFLQAFGILQSFDSTTPNKLMAAEVMTAASSQDLQSLKAALVTMDKQVRNMHVPKELSAGVAATILAGRRYDGTYPTDRFAQFAKLTKSYEAAAILAVMNVPYDQLSSKFQFFKSKFIGWGYMESEDTEIASAFLAIGELGPDEVEAKVQYIVEQLTNYLEYPLVAAAILASIPVFEAHEVLDLMEKAVTMLFAYVRGLERSEMVALAVRMIHGVRNELVKEVDSTAKITETPVQFTYATHPGFFIWYFPVIVAHSSYHATFSGMGGFHPAHSHGVGGFAG
jgi:hypothetical protein